MDKLSESEGRTEHVFQFPSALKDYLTDSALHGRAGGPDEPGNTQMPLVAFRMSLWVLRVLLGRGSAESFKSRRPRLESRSFLPAFQIVKKRWLGGLER